MIVGDYEEKWKLSESRLGFMVTLEPFKERFDKMFFYFKGNSSRTILTTIFSQPRLRTQIDFLGLIRIIFPLLLNNEAF